MTIDLNVDMGEQTRLWPYSLARDIQLLDLISSANLACGFHAGDATTMHQLVIEALKRGVAIGAHPSYPDLENFGRNHMPMSPQEVYDLIIYQLGALDAFIKIHGAKLHHVKPHGALYNDAAEQEVLAESIAKAVYDFDSCLVLYGLSGSALVRAGMSKGLKVAQEVFADRTYQPNGQLTPRSAPDALIKDIDQACRQVIQMATTGTVTAVNGAVIGVKSHTVCLHSDSDDALAMAKAIHRILKENNLTIKPIQRML